MNVCEICDHGTEHGWFGLPANKTHCRKCHRTFSAGRQIHCAQCCEHFTAIGTLTIHQTYDHETGVYVCSDPRSNPKLTQDAAGVWRGTGQNPFLARRSQARAPQTVMEPVDTGTTVSDLLGRF